MFGQATAYPPTCTNLKLRYFMGNLFSRSYYISDPEEFATLVSSDTSHSDSAKCKTYDYVVIGAGACGAVLASRISEDPNVTVLLVEAGPNHESSPFALKPLAFSKHFGTKFDWDYKTTPQPGADEREIYIPRGKLLGGCTSINAMMYHHCSPSDFDEWESLGATGWSYKDLAPYFRKSEKFTPSPRHPDIKLEDRGDTGPWQTGFFSWFPPIGERFLQACEEIGIPFTPDFNTARGTLGVARMPSFIDSKGQRSSSATAYLNERVKARRNLTISIKSVVTRILFSEGGKPRACGVEIGQKYSSQRYRVSVRKEVILCAGAINTPQILNLSGIGSKQELDSLGIKLVKDLRAVGKNLAEHIACSVKLRAKEGTSMNYMYNDWWSLLYLVYWLLTGRGPLTSNAVESAAFVRSMDSSLWYSSKGNARPKNIDCTSGFNAPDIELMGLPLSTMRGKLEKPPSGTDTFSIVSVLLRPLSSGRTFLLSADPFAKPTIDPNFFSHPNDIRTLTIGIRIALRVARAKAFQPVLLLKNFSEDKSDYYWPGDADPDKVTDQDLQDFIRQNSMTVFHPVGTARIGQNEKDSVVDPELRVHGVQGLRIVDASIFPRQISGHPTAPLIAIAERAAEVIVKAETS